MTDQITLASIVETMSRNVATIQTALKGDTSGYVWVWPKHWLAVKIDKDVCHAVAVPMATVTRNKHDKRIFSNGAGERAQLMLREKALCGALVHAVQMLETFQARVAA